MNRFWQKTGAASAVLMIALLLSVSVASAYTVRQVWTRVSAVAGETLTTGQVVCIKDADGYAWKADADVATLRPAVGIVGKGGAAGASVEIITAGVVTGWTSLAEGGAAYLSTTAAAVSQTASAGWLQQVGVAKSTTDYLFDFQAGGAYGMLSAAAHSYGAAAADWTLSATEAQATFVSATSASGAVNAILPLAIPGKIRIVYNNTGQVLTVKVTGQTGGTIANGKYALYVDNGTDVVEFYEQP